MGKQYWIKPDGHISVGMCLCMYEISVPYIVLINVHLKYKKRKCDGM